MLHTEQYEPLNPVNLVSNAAPAGPERQSEFIFYRRQTMNKDQVKGTAKDVAGKIQEAAGKATGSKEHEAKGVGKQVAGTTQKKYGDAKEAVKDAADKR